LKNNFFILFNKKKGKTGHYIDGTKLYYHDNDSNNPYEIPIPGFYIDICNSNQYIQCSGSGSCQSLSLSSTQECGASTDGKLINTSKGVVVCTKMNVLSQEGTNKNNYVGIPFTPSSSDDDRYLIHHANDIFNFDRTNSTTYYVIQKNTTAIIFDSTYNKDDQCADTSGLIIDRITDFCNFSGSGMYYTCVDGKCTSEFQLDRDHFEVKKSCTYLFFLCI